MASFFGLFDDEENKRENVNVDPVDSVEENGIMQLREEELNVSTHSVPTGEVILHKDIVEEKQTINVPVSHEEVVVERKAVNAVPSDEPVGEEETIRIPVSDEHVHVHKNTIVTGEVSLNKRVVEETQQVSDTVRKERAHVEVEGEPTVIEQTSH